VIWHRGQIIADNALRISVLDRTFEHGLGLFETLRTWNGHPTLLDRHLERMLRSAQNLRLPLDPAHLPDAQAVHALIEANHESLPPGDDVRLRITLSGGQTAADAADSTLWMTAGPVPPPAFETGASITDTRMVTDDDPLAQFKTLNYWRNHLSSLRAAAGGSDDVLGLTPAGLICETSRANLFLIENGRLSTPGTDGPLLPGVMRQVVVERADQMRINFTCGPLPRARIATADEAFLTNSVRGILPIKTLLDRELQAPGPLTRRLWDDLLAWLRSGATKQ
jgi:branched-chain amino acid aminotransferase